MKIKSFYILTFLLFVTSFTFAQVKFTTSVSKNKLGVNQRFRIEFSINQQGGDNFKPPTFSNFKVVSGPSSSVNQSWINGKSTYSQSYIYTIEPRRKGEFKIGSATIEHNGKTLKSNTVKITVTKEVEVPKDPNNPHYIAQQNIHLVAEVSKTSPYVGEGIYVVYKLYVSENISIHNYTVTENPKYNGFWNQDIKNTDNAVKKGKYNGEDYRYVILRKAVLIPQRAGKLVIEPIKMDFILGIPTGKGDWFGNMITKSVNYTTKSAARNLNVKSLPEKGKPINFTGAVGEYEFKVAANKNTLKVNEAAQIKVEVKGRGNLKLFEIPKITTPPELEAYTPEHNEKVSTSLNGLKGSVSDLYTVVPQYRGKYKIPAVSFSYFSPKQKEYKTINIDPIIVNVTEGKGISPNPNDTSFVAKQRVVGSDNNFRFIALKSNFKPKQKSYFFNTDLFYYLLFLPFLAIPIGIIYGIRRAKRAGDVFGKKIRKADKLAKKYLSEAKKHLGNHEKFYVALEKALHNFLKAKLHIETSDISKERISKILDKKGVETEIIGQFIEVLNDCDFARYTPTTNVMMKNEFEKAKKVITKIDKYL